MNELGPLSEEQRRLAERHLALVHGEARSLARHLRAPTSFEDLAAAGKLGLLEAAYRFDPHGTRTFPEYASFRVRGAMIDVLKRESVQQKYVLACARKAGYERAAEQPRGGNPLLDSDDDVRARLDDCVDATFASVFAAIVGAVERTQGEEGAALRELYARAIHNLRGVLETLAATERRLIELRFFDELTWDATAQQLGLSVKGARLLENDVLKRIGQRLRWLGLTAAPPLEGRV